MPALLLHRRRLRKTVILDVDGTLVDSNDAHARAWMDAFGEHGIVVEYDRVRRAIGMGGDKLMPRVSGISEESPEGARISERRGECFKARYLPDVQPFERVRELVQRFVDDGYTVAVASSAKHDELQALLKLAGVSDLIASHTSSDDAESSKPDPDIVVAALRRAGARPEDAVMLGDTPYDVDASRRAGVAFVGVESGGWWRHDLVGAIEVYASVTHLCDRYEQSVFSRLASQDRRPPAAPPRAPDPRVVVGLAASLAGVALLVVALRRRSRHRPDRHGDGAVVPRPALSRRDRERLRRIIERTS